MKRESIWHGTTSYNGASKEIEGNMSTDVLIIGGGLSGILCAERLTKAGVDCMVVEGGKIGGGTTGNTTGKVTAQHGAIYHKLIRKYGDELAGQYYDINSKAIDELKKLSSDIPCDFKERTAYVYSACDNDNLEREERAYRVLGIKGKLVDDIPVPVKTCGALSMENQAQFNPLKLLYGLAQGLNIYENTLVNEVLEHKVITDNGAIHAKYIVLATHFPFVNVPGMYFLKMYQHRSYVAAIKDAPDISGMYVCENKKGYSFRNYGDYLLVGGGAHKVGYKGEGYGAVMDLIDRNYGAHKIEYMWAAQDCMSLDDVPYIGVQRKRAENLMVISGFNKWGMTGAMAAAMVVCDLILKEKSEYKKLFSPQRSMMSGQLAMNVGSATLNLLRIGKRCTHMGCALKWNEEEKTWDCPCHGSRFSSYGEIIENPAKRQINIE